VEVENTLAAAPEPLWVEVAVAVDVVSDPVRFPLFVGFANAAVPMAPQARAIEDANSVFFMVLSLCVEGTMATGLEPRRRRHATADRR
jgi:hypothetical protein